MRFWCQPGSILPSKSINILQKSDPKRHKKFDRFWLRFLIEFGSVLGTKLEPCWPPRRPQDAPRCAQDAPRCPKTPPGGPKTPPKPSQDRSKTPPKTTSNIGPSWGPSWEAFATRKPRETSSEERQKKPVASMRTGSALRKKVPRENTLQIASPR